MRLMVRSKLMPARGLMLVITILLGAAAGPACAPPSRHEWEGGEFSGSYEALSTGSTDADYECPSTPNVVPDYDWMRNGTGRFKVCSHTTDSSKLLVHGATAYSATICIFPVNYVSDSEVFLYEGSGGGILSACAAAGEGGVTAEFPGIVFNAVFIVESPWKGQLETCLAGPQGPNYYFCPGVTGSPSGGNIGYYSFGQIR
jgi:hypothetical protein